MTTLDKEMLRAVIEEVDAIDPPLPEGAYWNVIAERVSVDVWVVQEAVAADPEFFGYTGGTP